jgi:hypothetical protein
LREYDASLLRGQFKKLVILQPVCAFLQGVSYIYASLAQLVANDQGDVNVKIKLRRHCVASRPLSGRETVPA